jgi:two-component system, NarL family, response regulator YdfI
MTRVLIRASSPIVKAGLETLIHAYPSLYVISDALDEHGAIEGAGGDLQPDVILAELEGRDDENASEVLDDAIGGMAVVLLVHGSTTEWADALLRQGVKAVLPGNATAAQVVAAIQAAAVGLVVIHPGEVEGLIPVRGTSEAPRMLSEALTHREIEVLRLLAEGLGNKEIAARLGISEHTVKFHVASIMGKLGAASRTEAVMLGIRRGIVLI